MKDSLVFDGDPPSPATAEQPKPTPSASTPIWDLVRADIAERDVVGRARYGTPLQAFNGRDPLVDAYQESLDKVVYLRQEIEERIHRGEIAEAALHVPVLESGCVRIHVSDLNALCEERRKLYLQVGDLQWHNNKLVGERRATINARVREFYAIAEQHIPDHIGVPADDVVRFRVRLVVEETLELVESVLADEWKDEIRAIVEGSFASAAVAREQTPFAAMKWIRDEIMGVLDDACADIDYVVEGARIAFGIDGEPVMQLVHGANLKKLGGPIRESDGKRLKPPGWLPPDIEGALVAQGWRP